MENLQKIVGRSESFAEFQARAPWWGGDLQTLRNQILGRTIHLEGCSKRLSFPVSDGSGDRMSALLDTPPETAETPLIVLIHGLTGCEESAYIRASAQFHLSRLRQVLRLNLRGAGPSRKSCGGHYHAGCASDLHDALTALAQDFPNRPLFLIGYSLGGNALINLLARKASNLRIIGAATVSAPIQPAEAASRIMAPRNWIYHRWLLRRMKQECIAPGAKLTDSELEAILNARTIYEFDDRFIAPRNGFAGADDYYTRTAGARLLDSVTLPLLLIHADNDPWIPAGPYRQICERRPPNVDVALTRGGGHVGFHDVGAIDTWHDRRVDNFLTRL